MKAAYVALGLGLCLLPAPARAGEPVRSSTTAPALSAVDQELARYLTLLESWDEIEDLELLELLPILEDADD